jgi:hypothetical protein
MPPSGWQRVRRVVAPGASCSARRWPAKLLRRPTDCAPCYRFECPFELRCLDIGPEDVVASTLRLLEKEESCVPFAS